MKEIKRVDAVSSEKVGLIGDSTKKRKSPSQPPRTDLQFESIVKETERRSPVLCCTIMMQALTGLRYSDASWLRFDDFYRNGKFVDSFVVYQQKTYNMKKTLLTKKGDVSESVMHSHALDTSKVVIYTNVQIEAVVNRCQSISSGSPYLFANSHKRSESLPMDIRSAEYHLKRVEKALGMNFLLRTHSFRKLFALKLISNGVTVEKIRDLLGQKSLESTNKYLSTIDIELKALVSSVNYKVGALGG